MFIACWSFGVFSTIYARALGAPWHEITLVASMTFGFFGVLTGFMGLAYGVCFVQALFSALKKERRLRAFGDAQAQTITRAEDYVDTSAFAGGIVGFIALQPLNYVGAYKSLAHIVHPYRWDPIFAHLDKILHFGKQPYEYITPLVDALHAEQVTIYSYGLWFIMMFCVCGYALFCDRQPKRRMRFLWALMLIWIVGGCALAQMFSSVGPAFYHAFYPPPDIYHPLIEHLKTRYGDDTLMKLLDGKLLEWTKNGRYINPNGLAAFPSMHIAIASLCAVYMYAINKKIGLALFAFTALVYVDVIFLGIHYAVDCYAGLFLSTFFWWVGKKITDKSYDANTCLRNRGVDAT